VGGNIWLTAVTEMEDIPNEEEHVQKGTTEAADMSDADEDNITWLRFTGSSAFRKEAKPGDLIVQIWKSKKGDKNPLIISPIPILFRQDVDNWTRFYIEENEKNLFVRYDKAKKALDTANFGRFGINSLRMLSEKQIEILMNIFKQKKQPGNNIKHD
jgi:hypothetical protein